MSGPIIDSGSAAPLNTHFVGKVGFGGVIAAAGIHILTALVHWHLGAAAVNPVTIILDGIDTYLVPALGVSAGYFALQGRPESVPSNAPVEPLTPSEASERSVK